MPLHVPSSGAEGGIGSEIIWLTPLRTARGYIQQIVKLQRGQDDYRRTGIFREHKYFARDPDHEIYMLEHLMHAFHARASRRRRLFQNKSDVAASLLLCDGRALEKVIINAVHVIEQ